MTSLYPGDIPATPLVLSLPVGIDGTDFDVASSHVAINGVTVAASELDEAEAIFNWAGVDLNFADAGLYDTKVTLSNGAGASVTVYGEPIVVESVNGWHSLASARAQWADAPTEDNLLYSLLETARIQCTEYAPALVGVPDGDIGIEALVPDPENPGYYLP
jgi:hypothetical protein